MATGGQPWTDQDVLMLRTYLEQGMRAADIARAMRTSYYRVKDKIRGLKDARKLERRNIERSRDIMHGYSRRAGALPVRSICTGAPGIHRHCAGAAHQPNAYRTASYPDAWFWICVLYVGVFKTYLAQVWPNGRTGWA